MHLMAQEEYGLRCLLNVARHQGPRELTIPEIAAAEGLSPEYTAKLMRVLRQGGLVASTRGASGGYHLARPPERITAWEAIQVLGGSFFPENFCDSHPGLERDCVHTTDCSIRALWRVVDGAVGKILKGITIAELLAGESSTFVRFGSELAGGRAVARNNPSMNES
jgi:Rrf2 family protein